MITKQGYRYDVFLSHNRADKGWVRQVAQQWQSLGLRVFFDEEEMRPGTDLRRILDNALENSRHIVLVITPQSINSDWVALEISATVSLDPTAGELRLIPVLLAPTPNIPVSVRRLEENRSY